MTAQVGRALIVLAVEELAKALHRLRRRLALGGHAVLGS